ncbi:hypothetical protein U9M48_005217 [Paspalum notatum var. saurae]|uniref:Uncharacterized protein n=1 Tax=Paspalum notatum var. saurae TaxID=547442 RepID=A0AAQ3SLR3_PASNO
MDCMRYPPQSQTIALCSSPALPGPVNRARSALKISGLKFWGFQDVVKRAWATPLAAAHPVQALHLKLAATARQLRS